jgi:hypothetical protein
MNKGKVVTSFLNSGIAIGMGVLAWTCSYRDSRAKVRAGNGSVEDLANLKKARMMGLCGILAGLLLLVLGLSEA